MNDYVEMLTEPDYKLVCSYLNAANKRLVEPDLVIAPDGEPYLYRWHLTPHKSPAGMYLHIQVKSDPERPLHDHPWDNTSTILSGGYDELYHPVPHMLSSGPPLHRRLRAGGFNYVTRAATEAHRLILPPEFEYTITIFTMGPYRKEWGFWYPDGFHSHKEHVAFRDGVSVHINQGE